jgi:hypothetical protein
MQRLLGEELRFACSIVRAAGKAEPLESMGGRNDNSLSLRVSEGATSIQALLSGFDHRLQLSNLPVGSSGILVDTELRRPL